MVDAAPKLCVEGTLKTRRDSANEKDYWDAQLKKQKFEENAGDLWRTDKVVEILAGVFKVFRENVTVFAVSMTPKPDVDESELLVIARGP